LAAYVRVSATLPLVVAANRDEFLARPASEPSTLAYDPWVVAGQDLTAGGTWFGVNQHGMVVGLLNRRHPGGPDPHRRSRGLLCLEVLQQRSPAAAIAWLQQVSGEDYNSFNLLVADARQAFVAINSEALVRITSLPPGVHLLTNLELNDPTCPRIAKSSQLFAGLPIPDSPTLLDTRLLPGLRRILSDHRTALDPRSTTVDTLCVHLHGYGTRSSSIVAAAATGALRYWHAPGPPCQTPYSEIALPPT
jgi:uncharacterized protein with NRDE domain